MMLNEASETQSKALFSTFILLKKKKTRIPKITEHHHLLALARGECDLGRGLPPLGPHCLHGLQDALAVHHAAEDHVAAVQPRGLRKGEEELAAVGVGAGVGHGEGAAALVLPVEVLVLELVAVDAGKEIILVHIVFKSLETK